MTSKLRRGQCIRCINTYQRPIFRGSTTNLYHNCASSIYLQEDLGQQYNGDAPDHSVVPVGDYYIRSFYGSQYDTSIFVFTQNPELRDWFKNRRDSLKENVICDACIRSLIDNEIEKVSETEVLFHSTARFRVIGQLS